MIWALVVALPALATSPDAFGLGARWSAMGGGSVGLVDDGTAAFVNPGRLGALPEPVTGIGLMSATPRVVAVPPLAWDTNRDGSIDDRDPGLLWDATPPSTFALDVHVARPLGRRVTFGLAAHVPTAALVRFATFDPQLPTYIRWANRTQRTTLCVGLGMGLWRGLSAGVSADVLARGRATARLTLDALASGDPEGEVAEAVVVDAHEIDLAVVPRLAPVFGLAWDLGQAHDALQGLSLGVRYHERAGLPLDVELDAQANVTVQDIGENDPYVTALVGAAQFALLDHHVPRQLDVGLGFRRGDTFRLGVDARWADWRHMVLNVAQVQSAEVVAPLLDLGDVVVDGNQVDFRARSTWSLRTGAELALPPITAAGVEEVRLALRGGFAFDPSMLVEQGPDSALIDPHRTAGTFGVGVALARVPGLIDHPMGLDAFGQVHHLAPGTLPRSGEAFSPGVPLDGGGIPFGGRIVAWGVQWRTTR